MEQGLQIFNHPQFGEIRAVEIDGEPWISGKDAASALGYANPQKAIRDHVDDEDKTVNESFTVNGTMGILINESGMYSLVISSKLQDARKFKRWVTSEVLPSIRKHGAYMTSETIEKVLTDPDTLIRLATQLKAEQEKRRVLEQRNAELEPKALFADSVASSQSDILIGDFAKILRQNGFPVGQQRLFRILREAGYLCKRKGDMWNSPVQRFVEQGLFRVSESAVNTPSGAVLVNKATKLTGKGQVYFMEKFTSGKINVA